MNTDIPALTSGQMRPQLTIQHRRLAPVRHDPYFGWLIAASAVDPDPNYDAVMVLFPNVVTDQVTGVTQELDGIYLGLTDWTGMKQRYSLMLGTTAVGSTNRAVFKHEFGHAILDFYSDAKVTPQPAVDNHEPANYVSCRTGRPYVLDGEEGDDSHPVTNGIYANPGSFTHDYYSGTTALATDPTRCLGVTRDSWAMGGPVTMPTRTLAVQARELGVAVNDLVTRRALVPRHAAALQRLARQTSVALQTEHPRRALTNVCEFTRTVHRMRQHRHLAAGDAKALTETAWLLRSQLSGR